MCPPFLVRLKRVLQSKLPSRTLLQHPPIHSCGCCYAFGRPVADFRGGNHWKSLEKKQHIPRQTDRQLLLLAPPIRLHDPMRLTCFFDGTKSQMIVINCLPYQLIHTEVKIVNQHISPEKYNSNPCPAVNPHT